MKIAITSPTTWPWVRRGAERFINEFAAFLASRGHEVHIISAKPGRRQTRIESGYTTICYRRPWFTWMGRLGLLEFHMFFFVALYALLRRRYDVVLSLTFMDGAAAALARLVTGTPYAFIVNGLPPKVQYFRSLSLGGRVFGFALAQSDGVIAISDFVADYFRRRWGVHATRLPVPLDLEPFARTKQRPVNGPVIVCASALDDRRKGGRTLFEAFALVKQRVPEVRLLIAYSLPEEVQAELLSALPEEMRGEVEFRAATDDLPAVLSEAAITVLPSLWEAYGMLVIESLAAGTPVAATRSGALPEHFVHPELGRLFDAGPNADEQAMVTNVAGLAQAIEECLLLARHPKTSEVCRKYARQFGWQALGPVYEEFLLSRAGAKSRDEVGKAGR